MSLDLIGFLFGPRHDGAVSCVERVSAVLSAAGGEEGGWSPHPGGERTWQPATAGLCPQYHSEGLGLVPCEEGGFLPTWVRGTWNRWRSLLGGDLEEGLARWPAAWLS